MLKTDVLLNIFVRNHNFFKDWRIESLLFQKNSIYFK